MNLQVDLRNITSDKIIEAAKAFPDRVRLLITAWQWTILQKHFDPATLSSRTSIVIPDFLQYARMAGTGQAPGILRLPASMLDVLRSGISSTPSGLKLLPKLARGQFWAAAMAMTHYDLGLIKSRYNGEVLLHDNLADFACYFEQDDFLHQFAGMIKAPSSWGIATQQVPAILAQCARLAITPHRLLFNTGISRPEAELIEAAKAGPFSTMKTTLDLTQWPAEVISSADFYDFSRPGDDTWLVSARVALELI